MTVGRVFRRHTAGWTATFFVFFVLLELAGLSLGWLFVFSCLLAVLYGTSEIARGETEWVGKTDPQNLALFGQKRDAVWYRVLAVSDWAAYLASVLFGVDLVLRMIS